MSGPGARGRFGAYGGQFVPETLMAPLQELEECWEAARTDPAFVSELQTYQETYAGRPTPVTHARNLSALLGPGFRIYLKREDLTHTGAHKINNTLGQALLAKRMGKKRVVAETGAGQHGVATAAVAALFNLSCTVYMGEEDMRRQALNVYRIRLLGSEVVPVRSGSGTLKDAISEAMRDWVTNVRHTHYILGSALGPHPYPSLVRDFQSVIGHEARRQIIAAEGRLPDSLVACVGGGSNAIGLFHAFLQDTSTRMYGIEAGGTGSRPGEHAARFSGGSVGVLQGTRTYILQDEHGNIRPTHSISAGLDYAAIGPQHAQLRDSGRATYAQVPDSEAVNAFRCLSRAEGIIPALESAHAIAYVLREAPAGSLGKLILVNLSGRGDKDVEQVSALDRADGAT